MCMGNRKGLEKVEKKMDAARKKKLERDVKDTKALTDSLSQEKAIREIMEKYHYIDENIKTYFLDEHGNPYARIISSGHEENWPISSHRFKLFVQGLIYINEKSIPSDQTLNAIIRQHAAKATFGNYERLETQLRVARNGNTIYVDPCRNDWRILKVSPKEMVADSFNLPFRRYNHMKELDIALDADASHIDKIFDYVSLKDPQDRLMFKVGLVLCFIPDIARVVDLIYGDQGSGKSVMSKVIKLLVDPSSVLLLSIPKEYNDMVQTAYHHYICCYDNVSFLKKETSDLICRLVTGEGHVKRALYTDDDDFIRSMRRKVMLNGINLSGSEPDFLDRSVTYRLERISKTERRRESQLWKEFGKEQPRITGALLKVLQKALSYVSQIEIKEYPRMADYGLWGEAVSRALGEKPGVFLHCYWQKIGSLNVDAIESHPVGLCIMELMRNREEWEGTADKLLKELEHVGEQLRVGIHGKLWPKAANTLMRRINTIKTNLQDEGVTIIQLPGRREGRKFIIRKSIVPIVLSSHDSENVSSPNRPHIVLRDDEDDIKNVSSPLSSSKHGSGFDDNYGGEDDEDDKNQLSTSRPPKSTDNYKTNSQNLTNFLDATTKPMNDNIGYDTLFSLAQKRFPELNEKQFTDAIEHLKKMGIIFESAPGRLQHV